MLRRCPRPVVASLLLAVAALAASPGSAGASLAWGRNRSATCEPPSLFYSSRHAPGIPPCCPTDDGVCPGGNVCPPSGVCPVGGTSCVPTSMARPNVILMVSDDQGECFYGSAGECRSTQTGTPIPAPVTPNLDALAAAGTVFAVAHNTASWCYPSLNSILTGRYQKSFGGFRNQIAERFVTIPRALRNLGHAPGTVKDPFDADARIGGYCSLQGGKFTASSGRNNGFTASVKEGERKLGRIDCVGDPAGGPPLCGSDASPTYDPLTVNHMRDLFQFLDGMVYKKPGGVPGEFAMQQFFVWYAPRIPHQPLRAPDAIDRYLFGATQAGMSGFFQLGQYCTGSACPPMVQAFDENNFGTVREYYANVYLIDANVREIRKYLQKAGEPHCIGAGGQSRFAETTPAACRGTWTTGIVPDPAANTVFIYLSDNGWQLPNSKHNFTENGYRTRLVVSDPRGQTGVASYDVGEVTQTAAYESDALAHSTDLLPSILGFALDTPPGTQTCPTSDIDGTPCDGRDFRAALGSNPGGPAPVAALRRSLCGHHTQRSTSPARSRYLLTSPGTVGRCGLTNAPACLTDAECASGQFCLGGACAAKGGQGCSGSASCPTGAICLAGTCQAGPPCIDDATCARLFPTAPVACVARVSKWCANAPDVACGSTADCPTCPAVNGKDLPCRRACEARMLKYYDLGGRADMTDLFLDPDEQDVHGGGVGTVAALLSNEQGPYGATLRQLACCVNDWWDAELRSGSLCGQSDACPVELTCNK